MVHRFPESRVECILLQIVVQSRIMKDAPLQEVRAGRDARRRLYDIRRSRMITEFRVRLPRASCEQGLLNSRPR